MNSLNSVFSQAYNLCHFKINLCEKKSLLWCLSHYTLPAGAESFKGLLVTGQVLDKQPFCRRWWTLRWAIQWKWKLLVVSDSLWPLGILQARIQEWVAIPSFQGIFPTQVSHIAGGFFTRWASRKAWWQYRTWR